MTNSAAFARMRLRMRAVLVPSIVHDFVDALPRHISKKLRQVLMLGGKEFAANDTIKTIAKPE
jgi:hypothetical protein